MSAGEFARLKHEVEVRQVEVDRAFVKLDDYVRKHYQEPGRGASTESAPESAEEKVVLLEHLMEAMSRLNGSYRDYTAILEKKIGF